MRGRLAELVFGICVVLGAGIASVVVTRMRAAERLSPENPQSHPGAAPPGIG